MSDLSLLDLGFFITETAASPKHVAGLLIFARPPRAGADFGRKLYETLGEHTDVKAPFNRLIRLSLTALPQWVDAESVDLAQHLHFHRLPAGANSRQALFDFVAALHEPMLDRRRPLWEVHLIDGLWDGHFALYQKMHHACADGVTMMRWTAQGLNDSAADRRLQPIWAIGHGGRSRQREGGANRLLQGAMHQLRTHSRRALGAGRLAAMLMLETLTLTRHAIALPFVSTARTPLTGQVTSGRQFSAAAVPMARVDALRQRTRSTVNHVALTCLDGALRRFLSELGVEIKGPLTIQMPVNLRSEGEKSAGNKIGIIQVELSPPTDDPLVRLRNVGFSLRSVRTMIDSVAPEGIEAYTIVTGLLAQGAELLRLSDTLPPTGNTLVSNVPGPKQQLYLMGAPLEEIHPLSTLPPSNLLNITLISYAGNLFFGLIATDRVPHLSTLANYVHDAFAELEQAVAGTAAAPAPRRPRARQAKAARQARADAR